MKPISAHWVTIPEEKIHTPASSAPVAKAASAPEGDTPVGHKIFWGIGFVVMIVVATALLAPKETLNLLQGNLFETTDTGTVATTTPDDGIQPLTLLPAESSQGTTTTTTTETTETTTTVVQNDVAVMPQTDATPIAVDPIAVEPISDENSALLEQLNQQVEAIKNNTAEPVRPSAPDAPVVTTPEVITVDAPVAAPVTPVAPITPVAPVAPAQIGYKPNSHTVSRTPEQMLAQNEATVKAKQGSAAAAITPDYTADLSGVTSTPDSGPREVLMICLALTFLSMFGYKLARAYARK